MNTAKIKTYLEQIRSGKIKTDRDRIFSFIQNNPGIIEREISKTLSIPLQTVSARCSDLKDLGLIHSLSLFEENKSTHEKLMASETTERIIELQSKRKREKWNNWLKKSKEFREFMEPEFLGHVNKAMAHG